MAHAEVQRSATSQGEAPFVPLGAQERQSKVADLARFPAAEGLTPQEEKARTALGRLFLPLPREIQAPSIMGPYQQQQFLVDNLDFPRRCTQNLRNSRQS